jgi:hypothetical protein
MRASTVLLLTALVVGACDFADVSKHYATVQDARADELFGKGWLPDILPPSCRDIHVSNDLDLNISSGEFHCDRSEFPALVSRLHGYRPSYTPLANLEGEVKHFIAAGYPVYEFTEDGSKWVFFCKPERGVCEYTMWVRRS